MKPGQEIRLGHFRIRLVGLFKAKSWFRSAWIGFVTGVFYAPEVFLRTVGVHVLGLLRDTLILFLILAMWLGIQLMCLVGGLLGLFDTVSDKE